ncbi:helix-turn-helix domain-containing protein [Aureimonas sp. ME7]|uniref:helix-turn-helix transcriptional regulator n=1 Tax=Aureimonas sp. ME7 TaxID=2744252 RepID=UPI0015F49E76|nr:helix-turn-helix domain-containing protein [Aureimonas sp. ME7]
MGSPLILTRQEAADLLGISTSTFDKWVRKGVAPASISGTRRWSRAALERAMSGVAPSAANEDEALSPFEAWKKQNARAPQRHQ